MKLHCLNANWLDKVMRILKYVSQFPPCYAAMRTTKIWYDRFSTKDIKSPEHVLVDAQFKRLSRDKRINENLQAISHINNQRLYVTCVWCGGRFHERRISIEMFVFTLFFIGQWLRIPKKHAAYFMGIMIGQWAQHFTRMSLSMCTCDYPIRMCKLHTMCAIICHCGCFCLNTQSLVQNHICLTLVLEW